MKAARNPPYRHKDCAMALHRRNGNNQRNQYQMALLRKESGSENISFQTDNIHQRAKQLFLRSPALRGPGCPAGSRRTASSPHAAGCGSRGERPALSRGISLFFFSSQGLHLKQLKGKGTAREGHHCQDEAAKSLRSKGCTHLSDSNKLMGLSQDPQAHLGFTGSLSQGGDTSQTLIPFCSPLLKWAHYILFHFRENDALRGGYLLNPKWVGRLAFLGVAPLGPGPETVDGGR